MKSAFPALRAELLSICGSEAIAFAHAQFSSDVRTLEDGQWQWSAWLDVRGRVQALLQLARVDANHLQALLRGGSAHVLADALKPYVMRAKVTLQAQSAGYLRSGPPMPTHKVELSSTQSTFGCGDYRLCAVADAAIDSDSPLQAWRLSAIRAGEPWLPDAALGAFVAQALSLERLSAISFAKGCFPGQEIAARLHYRGGHKKHLCRIRSQQAWVPGEALLHEDADVGMVLDCVHVKGGAHEALLVLQDDIAALPQPLVHQSGHATNALDIAKIFAA